MQMWLARLRSCRRMSKSRMNGSSKCFGGSRTPSQATAGRHTRLGATPSLLSSIACQMRLRHHWHFRLLTIARTRHWLTTSSRKYGLVFRWERSSLPDATMTGAGVVLAQRLEQLAAPNGVVIQGAAQEALPRRMPFRYMPLGEQSLKGFDDPIRAFSVELMPGADMPAPALAEIRKAGNRVGRPKPSALLLLRRRGQHRTRSRR